jgi:WD40 repeat protein
LGQDAAHWDPRAIQPVAKLDVPGYCWSVGFSPDGSLLAAGTLPSEGAGPGWVVVWDTATWREKLSLKVDRIRIQHVVFAPNGREVVASGLDESRLIVVDVNTGKVRDLFRSETSGGIQSRPAFSPDGRFMAVSTQSEGLTLWQVNGWGKAQDVLGFRDRTLSLVVDPTERWEGIGGRMFAQEPNGIVFKIVPRGMMPMNAVIPPGAMYSGPPLFGFERVRGVEPAWHASHLALAPDAKTAAIVAQREDNTDGIDLYDVRDPNRWRKTRRIDLNKTFSNVYSLRFAPDGQTLFAGEADRKIHAWDVATGQEFPAIEGHEAAVMELAFAPDGQTLATAGASEQSVRIWKRAAEPAR